MHTPAVNGTVIATPSYRSQPIFVNIIKCPKKVEMTRAHYNSSYNCTYYPDDSEIYQNLHALVHAIFIAKYTLHYMWPDLRKPNIIAQYRFFSIKHWNTLANSYNCVFWKKICSLLYPPCSRWTKRPTVKTGYHRIRPSKKSSKIFVWLQCTKGIVSYGRLFTWRRSGCLWSMFLHGFRLCLWWCRVVERITYPVIHSSVHGKHDGAGFKSVNHCILKLHQF